MTAFTTPDMMERSIVHLSSIVDNLDSIIPSTEQHRFHLIFRNQILESYDIFAELQAGFKEHSRYICCTKYIPLSVLVTKIQALWRGYQQRRTSLKDIPTKGNISIIIPACTKEEANHDFKIYVSDEEGLGCNNCYACISGGRKSCLNEVEPVAQQVII